MATSRRKAGKVISIRVDWKQFFGGLGIFLTLAVSVWNNRKTEEVNEKADTHIVKQDSVATRDSIYQTKQLRWTRSRDSIATANNRRHDFQDSMLVQLNHKLDSLLTRKH